MDHHFFLNVKIKDNKAKLIEIAWRNAEKLKTIIDKQA